MSNSLSLDIQQQVEKAVSILGRGGLVAFPTDTVYGLGASAGIPSAVERIFQVKERPRSMALPLLLADALQIDKIAEQVPPVARLLTEEFLPGALTIVLRRSGSVPAIVTAGGATVAVRIPDHPVPVAMIKSLGTPVVGTSANLSGSPSVLTAEEVHRQLGDKVDFIVDGGRCPGGTESTVVDVTEDVPVVLREGAISRAEIERVCGKIVFGRETG